MNDRQSRGAKAEQIVMAFERLRVNSDKHVQYVGDRHVGYDVQSTDPLSSTDPRYIEVKSVTKDGYIFITERERINLRALGKAAWLYLVDLDRSRIVRMIQDPISKADLSRSALSYKLKISEFK